MQTKRPQQPLMVLQTTKHRAIANARERDRTESVNNAFTLLRRLLPTNPKDRKLSKIEILRLATSYIHHLDNVCWAISNGEPSENVCCRIRSSTIRRSNVCTFCITSPLQSLNLFPQTNNQSEQFKNDNTTMVMYNENNLNQTETSDDDQQPPYRGSEFEFPAIPHIDIDDSGNNFLIMSPINYINNYGDNTGVVYVDHDEQAHEEFWPTNFSWPNDGDT